MKNKTFIILLILFFISIGSVSAMDNSTDISTFSDDLTALSEDVNNDNQLSASKDDSVLLETSQITVNPGDSIQSAIDNASEGSTIVVEKGNYAEDLIISKAISIIGKDAVLNSKNTAFNILSTANNTSISGFNIVVSDSNGTGIYVNASNCKITDNRISGGGVGILTDDFVRNNSGKIEFRAVQNLVILRNNITNLNTAGISINALNPTISKNRVTNIINNKENGTAIGIKANGVGLVEDDLNVIVTDNYISNVKSTKDSAYGLDIGGNSVLDTLVGLNTVGNIVKNVAAAIESYGVNVGVFSLNTTLPTIDVSDLTIRDISSNGENSSAVGLSVSVTTIGQNDTSDTIVHDIDIKNVKASGKDSTATGIDATGVGCVNVEVSSNRLKNIKSSKTATGISATGIDYTNFMALVAISNNNITDLKSSQIKGINLMSLGNGEINKNIMYNLLSGDTTFITGVTLSIKADGLNISIPQNATIEDIEEFLKDLGNYMDNITINIDGNLTVLGNNIEGTGKETGFAVVRPSEIHYNRAVNLKTNVIKESTRNFILESYGYDPSMSNEELAYILLKSQESFENCTEEELRNMSVSLGKFLDKFFADFDNSTAGDVDARYNWWGTNSKPPKSKFKNNHGSVLYDPWLILRVKSNPKVIHKGEFSKITADVYMDSDGVDHSSDAKMFFSGPRVTLSSDIGTFNGKKSITLNWTNGKAVAYLRGDQYGLATVTASDYETVSTTVLIVGPNQPVKVSAKSEQTMLPAGNPLLALILSLIIIPLRRFRN